MIKISSQIRAKRTEYQLTCDQLRFDLLFYKSKSHERVIGNEGPPPSFPRWSSGLDLQGDQLASSVGMK